MDKLIIRKANKFDNFIKMAELIYISDKYIFPYWFKNKEEGINTIADMMKVDNTMFSFKHCLIAEKNGEIIGLINFIDENSEIDNSYDKWNKGREFQVVLDDHLRPLDEYKKRYLVYLSYLAVFPQYRRRGVATAMLNYLFDNYDHCDFMLHCVANNLPAVKLYEKMGFENKGNVKGFNDPQKPIVMISKMLKKGLRK